ncbi:MAG: hypothetical protein ACPG5P_05105 [Saprospiraceae bacterium]
MNKTIMFETIRDLVARGKTKDAFYFLKKQDLNYQTQQILSILEGEYNQLREKEVKGIISLDEAQIQRNKINDKLLSVFQIPASDTKSNIRKWWIIPLLIVLFLGGFGIWKMSVSQGELTYVCPDFPQEFKNKILVLPFEKVGDKNAKPHIILRDRINQLSLKKNLSSVAEVGDIFEGMSMRKAPVLSEECSSNLMVWGTYSSMSDSVSVVLQYYFKDEPDWNNSGELLKVKDVTELQNGKMLKSFDDALMSLCGLIALRQGKNDVAKTWFDKVKHKEDFDEKLLKVL